MAAQFSRREVNRSLLLDMRRGEDVLDDRAFTGFTDGDPRIRLTLKAWSEEVERLLR